MNTGQPTHLFKVEETNQSKSICHTERRNRRQIMWAEPRPTGASVVETVLFFQLLKVLIMFSYTPHTCLPSFSTRPGCESTQAVELFAYGSSMLELLPDKYGSNRIAPPDRDLSRS